MVGDVPTLRVGQPGLRRPATALSEQLGVGRHGIASPVVDTPVTSARQRFPVTVMPVPSPSRLTAYRAEPSGCRSPVIYQR